MEDVQAMKETMKKASITAHMGELKGDMAVGRQIIVNTLDCKIKREKVTNLEKEGE